MTNRLLLAIAIAPGVIGVLTVFCLIATALIAGVGIVP
jgi:hypothetical protein